MNKKIFVIICICCIVAGYFLGIGLNGSPPLKGTVSTNNDVLKYVFPISESDRVTLTFRGTDVTIRHTAELEGDITGRTFTVHLDAEGNIINIEAH